ncbi:MAG TPA: NfeD family protein [Sedimentisphaerales bacterium]|nr:NfeD family protein [Sedimentisphaerales bacterium]
MGWIWFAIFLYLACAALLIAEVFVPSGGVISMCAFACLFGGIYIFYKHGTTACVAGVIVAIIMIPTVLVVAYRIFPRTKFGRGIILARPGCKQGDAVPDSGKLKELLGATGVVLTPLRPVGMCDFSGQRVECVAESGYVDKDIRVRVIGVESTQVTVREVKES